MAKKHFGRLLTLAAVVGAAAAGISYFLQYKSFHKELDEDFHDFEDDFDDFDDDTEEKGSAEPRSYVTLNTDHKAASQAKEDAKYPQEAGDDTETAEDEAAEAGADTEDAAEAAEEASKSEDTAASTSEDANTDAQANADASADETAPIPETTVTVEEMTE